MSPSRRTRIAALGLAASALLLPMATTPAHADPTSAAKTLAGMKYMWGLKSHALQVAQCRTYTANHAMAIQVAVTGVRANPTAASKLTPAEVRSVATKYLRWACAGPGGTPR